MSETVWHLHNALEDSNTTTNHERDHDRLEVESTWEETRIRMVERPCRQALSGWSRSMHPVQPASHSLHQTSPAFLRLRIKTHYPNDRDSPDGQYLLRDLSTRGAFVHNRHQRDVDRPGYRESVEPLNGTAEVLRAPADWKSWRLAPSDRST